MRWLQGRVPGHAKGAGRWRHGALAEPREAAELDPRALRPARRRTRRGPDLHLLAEQGRRRPDQQLVRSGRNEGDAEQAVRRRHGRPHHVRAALLDGADRLAHRRHRRDDHRQRLRHRQHAHHDPRWVGGLEGARQFGRLRARHAHGRLSAVDAGDRRRAVAVQQDQVHLALPGDARDLVLWLGLRRQRPAGQEVPRPAHRQREGARRGLDGRAHAHPQAHQSGRAGEVHGGGVPVRLRQDQPRHAGPHDQGLEGGDHRR